SQPVVSPVSLHDALPIYAVVEVAEVQLLVRRVRVLVRQPDAEEHGWHAELLLERGHDRDRAPLTVVDGGLAEPALDGAPGRLDRSEEHTSELQSREKLVC